MQQPANYPSLDDPHELRVTDANPTRTLNLAHLAGELVKAIRTGDTERQRQVEAELKMLGYRILVDQI